jgi:hypothetical protein
MLMPRFGWSSCSLGGVSSSLAQEICDVILFQIVWIRAMCESGADVVARFLMLAQTGERRYQFWTA